MTKIGEVTAENFEKLAIYMLEEILAQVPSLSLSKPIPASRGEGELFPMDGAIKVRHSGGSLYLFLEVKKNAQLRDVRTFIDYQMSVDRIKQFAKNLGGKSAYPVFASQYLTPAARAYCKDKGVGYFDLSGNCRLAFEEVYIEREMPLTIAPERKRLRSLFSTKSARVMRRLLDAPQHVWRVQDLAENADVSTATVSLLKSNLLGEGYAARQGEGFFLSRPETLLLDWARHYNARDHKRIDCFAHGELEEIEERFAKQCEEFSTEYAFTMFAGARRIASFTRGIQRSHAYVVSDQSLTELAKGFGLKPVDSGGNFRLIIPNDPDILYKSQIVGDITVVSDIQLYLDLAGHQGRGEENAEYLLEQRIKPEW
jgi:hypothetical protein